MASTCQVTAEIQTFVRVGLQLFLYVFLLVNKICKASSISYFFLLNLLFSNIHGGTYMGSVITNA